MSHLARKFPNTVHNNASKKGGKEHSDISKIAFIIDTVLIKDNLRVFRILKGQLTKKNKKLSVCWLV
jgi:hypothetical protein